MTGAVRENNMADLIGMLCSGQSCNNIANNPKSQWPNITEVYFFVHKKPTMVQPSPLRHLFLGCLSDLPGAPISQPVQC